MAWQTFDNDIKACRDLEQNPEESAATSKTNDEQAPVAKTMMMKKGGETEIVETKSTESKSFKDTLKDKLESIKSLFN